MPLTDKFGRPITDLRISITDRCNYKCVYCRTGNEGALYGDLPFADYLRMARVLVGMGVTKIRLTGGEPLLRKGVVEFVRDLAKLRAPNRNGHGGRDEEPLDIALTTNGHLLADLAQPLKAAGLTRVTVSMDAVDPDRFARITRVPNGYDHVLAGIRAARRAGLWPLKVNCVLMRGFNEDQIIPFGMFAREEGVTVRFIEFMPLEEGRTWSPNTVVTLDEILARMAEYRPLVEIPHARSETARRYRFDDGVGEIGIIAPVSHPFLRTLQPYPHHQRRQNPHLPVFGVGPRPARPDASRRQRRRVGRFHSRRDPEKRRTPSHRRTGFRARVKDDGAYRGMKVHLKMAEQSIDHRALKILSSTYWSPSGWKKSYSTPPEDFAYAKASGFMFDSMVLSHDEKIEWVLRSRSRVSKTSVANGFLASLTSRRLDRRSALGSFAVSLHMPTHRWSKEPGSFCCSLCGGFDRSNASEDLNILNFERFKWGGVRHTDPLYIAFDLKQFSIAPPDQPTEDDLALMRSILDGRPVVVSLR